MRTTTTILATLLLLTGTTLTAQIPDGSASRAALDRLGFMVGRWRGEAWMARGPERVQTQMTEVVERRLDGVVLLIDGLGVVPATGGGEARVVHHALGVLYFDPQAGRYVLRSWINTGQWGDFAVTLADSSMTWSREVPGGRIRNTARFTGTEWHEVGEFSRDGAAWTRIMEIRLHRDN